MNLQECRAAAARHKTAAKMKHDRRQTFLAGVPLLKTIRRHLARLTVAAYRKSLQREKATRLRAARDRKEARRVRIAESRKPVEKPVKPEFV